VLVELRKKIFELRKRSAKEMEALKFEKVHIRRKLEERQSNCWEGELERPNCLQPT